MTRGAGPIALLGSASRSRFGRSGPTIPGVIHDRGRWSMGLVNDFKAFLLRGNVVDLAVAVVIGVAFTALVTSFVEDLLTPLIAAIVGEPDFSGLTFTLNGSEFRYGSFINAAMSFL